MSVVLVTGASTGFGRLTVEALARRGHRVFAGVRDVAGRNRAAAAELPDVVELDVTDDEAAVRAVDTVVESAGRIDVVVNNAGVVFGGPVEAFTAQEAARQFDVNVWGALRVNRAAIAHMRRQGNGALIQIGSVSDRVSLPWTGLYGASKAALASLTEAWRYELADFGIESVSVEVGAYDTNLAVNGVMPGDLAMMRPYGAAIAAFMTDLAAGQEAHDRDPRPVAEAVVALVETPDGERPHRTVVATPAQREALTAANHAVDEAVRLVFADMGLGAHRKG